MRPLFVLSQRPELTGSGITLDSLVRHAAAAGHEPWVLCGVPVDEPRPTVGGLPPERILTVTFGPGGDLPYPVPGMSDVMPYESTVWSSMTGEMLEQYRQVWRARLSEVGAMVEPDVLHLNHCWLMAALASDVLPSIPSLGHCHATGLRQMQLCPHLRDEVVDGLRKVDRFAVLHAEHAALLADILGFEGERISEVGAGYRQDLFHDTGENRPGHLLFVGKFAAAKGLPWLLDACEQRWQAGQEFTLHIAGDGAGKEAEALRRRMQELAPRVVIHGRLSQAELADLMRTMAALVLPSFYEGLPLVLAEARACGCRLVSTALPGVVSQLAPAFADDLVLVQPPRLVGPDTPVDGDLPAFTTELARGIDLALSAGPCPADPAQLAPFTWSTVFQRVETEWQRLFCDESDR